MNRREALRTLTAGGLCTMVADPRFSLAQPTEPAWQAQLVAYLETLARTDGGYAWPEQSRSHLTPTFAVIGCYHLLKQEAPHQARLAEFVRTHHPFRLKKLERDLRVFEYQQIQSLLWLGADTSSFREQVQSWQRPSLYPAQYEQHRYPVFQNEMKAVSCRALLGLSLADLSPELIDYLNARRRANGSFNNTPAADGSDGHVMNTWWGLEALVALGRSDERATEITAWLRSCQLPSGGFTHQPQAEIGGVDDVAYTWAALRALRQLGAEPADRDGCLRYLLSLRTADGGFANRPGWASNPLASYYALDALAAFDALDKVSTSSRPAAQPIATLPRGLKVFSIQIEAHGKGSPQEAVDLAGALKIHLWGAKNAQPEWLARAQAIADRQSVPVKFFVANEEYGTWVNVPGMGTYSHTSDIVGPAGVDLGPSLAGQGVASWPEFRQRRVRLLEQAGGRLVWQFGENEELTRLLLDDSLAKDGFAAISTFHFGNPDFTNSEPFLYQYRQQLPFIALQDAHGNEPWWFSDMTTGFRTLFLAEEPTWDGWLAALKRNWVMSVRRDAVSGQETWMHGGTPTMRELVLQHADAWRWWDNPGIQRPMVSLVAVKPDDLFEAARPEQGVTLRIRCAWENTTQGVPKRPLAELVKLIVDGQPVATVSASGKRAAAGMLDDHYHHHHLAAPGPGRHSATATVRVIATGKESTRTTEF